VRIIGKKKTREKEERVEEWKQLQHATQKDKR
jgi:hypothetical protein